MKETEDQDPETDESDVQGELHDKDEEEKDKSEVVQPERTVPEDNEDSDKEGDRCGTDAWRRESEADRVARLFWACKVCPDRPEMDKGEEKSAICNICKNNMELFEVADWMPPLPMRFVS